MTRSYRKPLRGGGSRIIPRTSGGRFTRWVIDVGICSTAECRSIIVPTFEENGGFAMKKWPETCPRCGTKQEE